MTLTILALDPATVTGWACSDGSSGEVVFTAKHATKTPTPAMQALQDGTHGAIGTRFSRWLDSHLDRTQAGVLVLERVWQHRLLLGLRMVALVQGHGRGLLVEEVVPAQWQKWATTAGVWTKADKSNEADAQAILAWWRAVREPLMIAG